jgi:cation transport regulator ChaC
MFFNFLPLFKEMLKIKKDETVTGILPYVKREDNQNSWSYIQLDENNFVTQVKEKDLEMFNAGCPGIIGAYTFNQWRYFTEEAKKMITEHDSSGEAGKKEYYLSRVFQRLISKGAKVRGADVTPSWVLGTPAQFLDFENFLKI